jgi:prolipoprotein diacylglyceryltransferase
MYESLFHALMAISLFWLTKKNWLTFQRLKFYLIGYALFRFLTEYIRPEPILWSGLTFYQLVALVGSGLLVLQWWYDARHRESAANGPEAWAAEPRL